MSDLKQAGVKLIADGAEAFLDDMKKATGAVGDFGAEGEKSGGLMKGLGDIIGNVGKIAAGVAIAGFGALTAALGFSVKEAMDAQVVQAQLEAVLKSTGGAAGVTAEQANNLATELSSMTRFGDEAILSGENMLLTFTNIGKDVFPLATEAMLDLAQATGTDLKGAAIQLGKALNDPVGGITALTRVGVTFSDEQKKMIESMVAAGDVAGAQKVILAELQKEFGGSAVAAGKTFAGQLDILKNRLSNVAESVGMALLPALSSLIDNVITPALPIVESFGKAFALFFETIAGGGGIVTALGPVADVVTNLFGLEAGLQVLNFGAAIQNVIGWLQTSLPIALQFVSDTWTNTLQPALQGLWDWLQNFIPQAIMFLVGIWNDIFAPIFVALADLWVTTLQPVLAQLWDWLQVQIPIAIQAMVDFWNNTLYPALIMVADWIATTLIPTIGQIVTWLAENIPVAIQTAADFWANTLQPALLAVWAFIQESVIPLFVSLQEWLATNLPVATQALSDFWNNTLLPVITAVWAFVNDKLIPLWTALAELFNVAMTLAIVAMAGLWEKTLQPAIQAVADYISKTLQPVFDALIAFWNDTLDPAITEIAGWFGDTLVGAIGGVSDAIENVIGWVNDLIEALQNVELPDWMTPGSPTPWEIGLRGVTSAMKQLVGSPMLSLETNLKTIGKLGVDTIGLSDALTPSPVSPVASPSQISNVNNNTRTVNINFTGNYSSAPSVRDQNDLAYMLGLAA